MIDAQEMDKFEKQQQFITLRAKGISYQKIALQLHIAKGTAISWNREFFQQISEMRKVEIDNLIRSHKLHREEQLKQLGKIVKMLRKEMKQRDLKEVPTVKLLELILKYEQYAKEEVQGLQSTDTKIDPILTAESFLDMYHELFRNADFGIIAPDKIKQLEQLVSSMYRTYEGTVLEKKLDTIIAVMQRERK
jgi:hypothetical protein